MNITMVRLNLLGSLLVLLSVNHIRCDLLEAKASVLASAEDLKRFEEFKKSPLYVPPFDPNVLSLPNPQLLFVRKMAATDIELYRTIAKEAIDKRNGFAPSISLMFKYTGKLLTKFIKNRREELTINPRVEPAPEFFGMLADLFQTVLDKSSIIKVEKGYTKKGVDVNLFYDRVNALFDYLKRIVDTAPNGAYVKWNELTLFKDNPMSAHYNANLIDEAAELVAQFRGMGYESSSFVGRRIVNLLRKFSHGVVPADEKEV